LSVRDRTAKFCREQAHERQRHPACDDKHVIPLEKTEPNGCGPNVRISIAPGSDWSSADGPAGASSFFYYRQLKRAVITGKPNWQPFPDLRDAPTGKCRRSQRAGEFIAPDRDTPELAGPPG
jgi:hypothetical protein